MFVILLVVGSDSFSQSDTNLIWSHLNHIINTETPRNFQNNDVLNDVSEYIYRDFSNYSDSVEFQSFYVPAAKDSFRNVIASFGCENKERIIIGAHYDVCGEQDGADDNASGIVGLLELARMLNDVKLNYRIDLVAYTLEEPPFFRSEFMGSFIHAKYLYDNKINTYGMICLEMIGYFSDKKHSQSYPLSVLKMFYGNKGDFITVVSKFGRGKFARKYKRKMKKSKTIKTKGFKGPAHLTGIDFSDHMNYWNFGFDAVMITNTGFFRNKNYHKGTDLLETLDVQRMSGVIDAVYETVIHISDKNN